MPDIVLIAHRVKLLQELRAILFGWLVVQCIKTDSGEMGDGMADFTGYILGRDHLEMGYPIL